MDEQLVREYLPFNRALERMKEMLLSKWVAFLGDEEFIYRLGYLTGSGMEGFTVHKFNFGNIGSVYLIEETLAFNIWREEQDKELIPPIVTIVTKKSDGSYNIQQISKRNTSREEASNYLLDIIRKTMKTEEVIVEKITLFPGHLERGKKKPSGELRKNHAKSENHEIERSDAGFRK